MSVNPWNEDVTCGIENHCKALFLSTWVHVEPSIDALVYNTFKTGLTYSNCSSHLHIWPPHMNQIRPQHLAMLLVEGHPSSHNLPDTKITTGSLVSTLWLLSQRGGGLYSRQQHQRRDTEPGPKSTPPGGRSLARTPHQDRRHNNQ